MKQHWRLLAGISGAMAVAMGAVASHVVQDPHAAEMIEKAAFYQLVHSAVLLYLSGETGRVVTIARLAFLMGVVFFSGGLYLRYMSNILFLNDFIPFGGLCYIFGWVAIAVLGFEKSGK